MTMQGPRWVVSVGEKTIDYSESFRMFLATRSPSPCVPPDVASLITVVNFSVTLSGLEGQLLGLTIEHEQVLAKLGKCCCGGGLVLEHEQLPRRHCTMQLCASALLLLSRSVLCHL